MRRPITLRPLTAEEQQTLRAGLRSSSSFTLRRCQILLASQGGQHVRQIAERLHGGDQTVRNVLHAFNTRGLAALEPHSRVPHQLPHPIFDATRRARLRELLHQSPWAFGYPTSVWTLPLAAQVAYAQGITARLVSGEAIRPALQCLQVSWKRAKHWISVQIPTTPGKKNSARG